jgi:hypothetical protein
MEMQDTTAIMADDEEAIKHAERDSRNREEVHRCDGFSMITQKGEPAFGNFSVSRRFAHPTGNGSLRNIETEHEKLTVDARCSRSRIFGNHLEDQISNFLRDLPSAELPREPGNDSPVEPKPSPTPLNDSVGKRDDKRLLPAGPNLASGYPEHLVE